MFLNKKKKVLKFKCYQNKSFERTFLIKPNLYELSTTNLTNFIKLKKSCIIGKNSLISLDMNFFFVWWKVTSLLSHQLKKDWERMFQTRSEMIDIKREFSTHLSVTGLEKNFWRKRGSTLPAEVTQKFTKLCVSVCEYEYVYVWVCVSVNIQWSAPATRLEWGIQN